MGSPQTKSDMRPISDRWHYLKSNDLSGYQALRFHTRYWLIYLKTYAKIRLALVRKEIAIGPFKGEFGNFLGHVLPLLMYLHARGVRIHFCGFEILRPYLKDQDGRTIIHQFHPLRDIYQEFRPSTNFGEVPDDVSKEILSYQHSVQDIKIKLDLQDEFYYWFVHRKIVADHFSHCYDLGSSTREMRGNECALFPRKGEAYAPNQGMPWNYDEVIESLLTQFERVYIVGHPEYVQHVRERRGVIPMISNDNEAILNCLGRVRAIFSPHSGVIYLSAYFRVPFVLMYKDGKSVEDIGSIQNTQHFLRSLSALKFIKYCFSLQDLERITQELKTEKIEET